LAAVAYVADGNPSCTFRERDTILSADVSGKTAVTIAVVPSGSWDVARYTVFSVF
jgi:hypothetical protein